MRFLLFILFIGIIAQTAFAQRTKQLINFDWKFSHGEFSDAKLSEFDDSKWETVQLPHDASIAGPFVKDSLNSDRKNGFLPRQKGWYRKVINIETTIENRKIFLEFEGIYRDARVFLNGTQVAHQLNGFEGFLVDVSKVIKQGENIIAVSYDNTDMESSRWYNGEGIYRDVWLICSNEIHVNYNGTYVSTPIVLANKAKVNIETEVWNQSSSKRPVTVKSEIYSPEGYVVGEVSHTIPINAGELYICRQETFVANPLVWDLKTPNLYLLKTWLIADNDTLDIYFTDFGIRTIEFNRNQGMLLNGEKVFAKGVNIHHDLGPLGAAAFERGFERRLEGLKKLGCNAIRLSHNPHDKAILEWCDRNGMLVFDEAFDKWSDQFFGKGNSFEDHWKASLTAFLKRDRNHPSVFIWSVGNEVKQQKKGSADYGIYKLAEMVDFVHKFEPSRKVTCGLHPSRARGSHRTDDYYYLGPPEMEFYMDIVSTNYREEFWPVDRRKYPQLTYILSEAQVGNLGNEWFNLNHHSSVGIFYWGGTDYIGESFGWPSKGWGSGIIDWNDHWKPFSYYINSLFSDEPMVHIAIAEKSTLKEKYWNEVKLRYQPLASHWSWNVGDTLSLLTFSNCQEVELLLNGKTLGTKKVPEQYYTKDITAHTAEEFDPENPVLLGPEMHKKLEWPIVYEPGSISVLGKINGKVVARHELQTAQQATQIILEADRTKIKANGLDLSYITVKVIDKNGVLVPDADYDIQFEVQGEGIIQAVSNADLISNESFVTNHRKAFQGKALLIVRSTRKSGAISIKAKAEGLKTGTVKIESKKLESFELN